MSKRIATIPLSSIARISILFGSGRSMAQVKGDADYILNGGFYDMTTGKPVGHLKVGGKVLSKEEWNTWCYAWSDGPDISMKRIPIEDANYIGCVPLLTPWNGLDSKLSYPAAVGGYRPRTAIALAGDKLLLYCADSPTTPEKLRQELHDRGATTALMLDSGGSSQCDFGAEGRISSSRRVHNYIAVWLKKEPEKEDKPMSKKVVLDPGHGVETAGKRSPDGTYLEHEFNLDMAKRLKAHLEHHGVSVTLTRTTEHDVSIQERANVSNAIGPDLFVSLHSNASGDGKGWTAPDGYGIYTSAAGETAGRNKAAKAILVRAKEAGIKLWGSGLFHDADDGKKDIAVLWRTVAPAVLIEHGFHTNKAETEKLQSPEYRALLARVDAKGILDYLGIAWVDEPATAPETPKESAFVCPHCGGALKIEKG